jgi:hypothetical protein
MSAFFMEVCLRFVCDFSYPLGRACDPVIQRLLEADESSDHGIVSGVRFIAEIRMELIEVQLGGIGRIDWGRENPGAGQAVGGDPDEARFDSVALFSEVFDAFEDEFFAG